MLTSTAWRRHPLSLARHTMPCPTRGRNARHVRPLPCSPADGALEWGGIRALILRETRLSVRTASLYRYLQTCQADRRRRGPFRSVCRGAGCRLGALWTILSLLTLLVVSGPHLVHHLVEPAPHDDHHTPAGSAHP